MRKTKILGKNVTNQELKDMQSLAAKAGCDEGDVEIVQSVGDPDPDCEDEVIIVFASPATCADPGLEKELAKAQNGGRRVVCVWPKAVGGSVLPEGTKKYAYSIIPWDAKKLAAVLADDDVTCFETDAGTALPKVPMDHNLCIDEPKKPK